MKITVNYNQSETQSILIDGANYAGDFLVKINFSDGSEKIVNFKPFLTKAYHPSIKKYSDEGLFSSFKIIDGNLNWNDNEMLFPVQDLYNGKIGI